MARPRQIVSPGATPTKADYDLVVVGGNLGILLATALAVRLHHRHLQPAH